MVDLPEVTEEFSADTGPFVAGLEVAINAAERLKNTCIEAGIAIEDLVADGRDLLGMVAPAEAAASAVSDVGDSASRASAGQEALAFSANRAAVDLSEEAVAGRAATESLSAVADSAGDVARASVEEAAGLSIASDAEALAAKNAYLLAMAQRMQANTARDAAADTAVAGTAAGVASGFWSRWGTVIHWVVAGGAEFLAVFIPATVAAGGAAAVMAQGVGDLYEHLMAMYDAQEATANIFHETTGEMVGMKDVLQQAQNAADPRVFELLGAGINIARADSGQFVQMGTEVLNVLDQFAAKITGELTGALGGQLHGLLSAGVQDLTEFGQILGNVGHATVDLAGDMPGLAEVLLRIVDAISQVILWISRLPSWVITTVMVMEELYRWGGLLVSILARIPGAIAAIAAAPVTFLLTMGEYFRLLLMIIPAVITQLAAMAVTLTASLLPGVAEAAAGLAGFMAEVTAVIAEMSVWEALLIGLAIGGFVFLAVKALTAKTAMEQWADSVNSALEKTSDLQIIPKIATDIADATQKAAQAQQQLSSAVTSTAGGVESRYNGMSEAVLQARGNLNAATQEVQHLDQAQLNLLAGTGMLARQYQTTFIGALALAQGAGVNLTNSLRGQSAAAVDARLQIANYVAGMGAMGESSTAVGRDVTMLGISSALTATKVQQLNQAVDQFVSGLTGGTAGMGALMQSIQNVGQAIGTTTGTISDATNGLNLSLKQVQGALTNFGAIGSQVWQNFDQALSGSAEQLADWFRTAGAEGAIGSGQFTTAMQAIVAQFVPFAAKSATAQAELVGFAQAQGLNVTKFSQLQAMFKSSGQASNVLSGIIGQTTDKMANMNQVAQALGSSIGTDVVGAMNNARVAASGLTGAAQSLSEAWNNEHQINYQVVQGFAQTYQALLRVYGNTNLARQAADAYAQELGLNAQQIAQLNTLVNQYSGDLNRIPRNVTTELTLSGYITPGAQAALAAMGVPGTTLAHVRGTMPGQQLGAAYVPPGVSVVGEAGPELVRFRGGEQVTPAWRTEPLLRGAGGGGGGSPSVVHSHIYIDGRELFTAVQNETFSFNRRNGLTTTGSMAPPG